MRFLEKKNEEEEDEARPSQSIIPELLVGDVFDLKIKVFWFLDQSIGVYIPKHRREGSAW